MIVEPITRVVDILAVRALLNGTADKDQQKIATDWILFEVCRRKDNPFQPGADGERDTNFELGRHFCGVQIANCLDDAYLERVRKETIVGITDKIQRKRA